MISPWPRWNGLSHLKFAADTKRVTQTEQHADFLPTANLDTQTGSGSMVRTISTWWQNAIDSLEPATAVPGIENPVEPSWARWIPWILAIGIGLGLARLAAGMWSVARLRRESIPVDDADLYKQLSALPDNLAHRWLRFGSRRSYGRR